jgi:hypothetical protein
MVGSHEHEALKLHSAVDLFFRLSRLAMKSHVLKALAKDLDERPSDAVRHLVREAIAGADKAVAQAFMELEAIDDQVKRCRDLLDQDDRPEVVNGGFEVFGGEAAEAALDKLAALYKLDRHKP